MGICNQITILFLYYISSTLVTLLKVTDVPVKVSVIFYLTVNFRLIDFSFQNFFLFVPEMSTSFTCYSV